MDWWDFGRTLATVYLIGLAAFILGWIIGAQLTYRKITEAQKYLEAIFSSGRNATRTDVNAAFGNPEPQGVKRGRLPQQRTDAQGSDAANVWVLPAVPVESLDEGNPNHPGRHSRRW